MRQKLYKSWNPAALGSKLKYWHRSDEPDISLSGTEISSINNLGTIGGTFDQGASASRFNTALVGDSLRRGMLGDGNDYMNHSGTASDWKFLHDGTTAWFWAGTVKLSTERPALYEYLVNTYQGAAAVGIVVYIHSALQKPILIIGDGTGTLLNLTSDVEITAGITHTLTVAVESGFSDATMWIDGEIVKTQSYTVTPSSADPVRALRIGHTTSIKGQYPEGFIATEWPTAERISQIHTYLYNKWHEWNPSDLGDALLSWWDPNNEITTVDGYVSLWSPVAGTEGTGRNVSQGTGSQQPTHESTGGPNGGGAIKFDSANSTYLQSAAGNTISQPHTVVMQVDFSGTAQESIFDGRAAANQFRIFASAGESIQMHCGTGLLVGGTRTGWVYGIFSFNNTNSTMEFDDGGSWTGGNGTGTSTGVTIGAIGNGASDYFDGRVGHIAHFNRLLTEEEKKKLFIWLERA